MVRCKMDDKVPGLKEALRSALWAQGLTAAQMARVEATTFDVFVPKGG